MLTQPEIDELRRLADAATLGLWESVPVMLAGTRIEASWNESPWRIVNGPPQVIQNAMMSKRAFERKEDAAFIARAREALPRLLDALEAANRDIERLWEFICLICRARIDLAQEVERLKGDPP